MGQIKKTIFLHFNRRDYARLYCLLHL